VPASAFDLPGVREVTAIDSGLAFYVDESAGTLDRVIKRAAEFEVTGLRYEQASLEDIFLTYYRRGDDAAQEGGDVAP
jgi:hypothetical protein